MVEASFSKHTNRFYSNFFIDHRLASLYFPDFILQDLCSLRLLVFFSYLYLAYIYGFSKNFKILSKSLAGTTVQQISEL